MGRLPLTARPLVFALPKESLVLSSIVLRPKLSRLYSTTTAAPSQDLRSRPNFNAIDKKWRQYLNHPKDPPRKGKKFYILSMFPYPSGRLHMGHLRVYTISDVLARFERMRGCQVIHPMGWDAFGLPAENAAIEGGIGAREWTEKNIEKMKEQFSLMGVGFDWDREIKTCSPEYYVHTQRLFLDLYKHGLAYRAESIVNWDPVDKTVLANEQVSPDGVSWRSGAMVEKINLKQWFFKITAYSDALLKDLRVLEHGWPSKVTRMQVNWIGESKGAIVTFPLITESPTFAGFDKLEVFTTRLDTIHGVQFLAVSASHPLAIKAAETNPRLEKFLQQSMVNVDEKTKKGIRIRSITARNPLSDESIPIYVASYVIAKHGTGALMGVPGHDPRDKAFWTKRSPHGDTIKVVIEPDPERPSPRPSPTSLGAFQDLGILNKNCGEFAGMTSEGAQNAILAGLSRSGLAAPSEQLRLRDWLVSRQRYWGTPIPMIHCPDCGPVPVKDEDLPVVLPEIGQLSSKGGNALAGVKEWVETACPECGKEAKRETDTMDTFVDSSWYFMRYVDPHNKELAFSPELADSLLPVDLYVGGIEHAILHLLYSRFIAKFMHSSGKWPSGGGPDNRAEPFKRLVTQGMVLGKTYKHPKTKGYLRPEELEFGPDAKSLSIIRDHETPLIVWEKMSKSKFNGTDPQKCIEEWGADATRVHMLFQGRVEDELQWDEERIIGIQRWFEKIWKHVNSLAPKLVDPGFLILPNRDLHNMPVDRVGNEDRILFGTLQETIRDVSFTLSKSIALNTVISSLIKLTNLLVSARRSIPGEPPGTGQQPFSLGMNYRTTSALLKMLSPVAPGFSEECWEILHEHVPQMAGTRALQSTWPWFAYQEGEDFGGMATCTVQVNGRVRLSKLEVDRKQLLQTNVKLATRYFINTVRKAEEMKKWISGRKIKKVYIAANGKVVNLLVDDK